MRINKKITIAFILLLSAAAGLMTSIHDQQSATTTSVAANTVEISQVAHYPLTFVAQLKNDPGAGRKIFKEYCASCHAAHPLIPVHAPAIGNKNDWARFSKMSLDQLFKLAAQGYGAMPARGGCFECSDAQLKLAIEYLLHPSHRN